MTPITNRTAVWGRIALTGFLLSTMSLISLHFLKREYSIRDDFISEYAVGNNGWLMALTFVALGMSSLALAIGMRSVQHAPHSRHFEVSLIVAAAGLFVMALFQTDPNKPSPRTLAGSIHDFTSVVTFFFGVAALGIFAWKIALVEGSPPSGLKSLSRVLTIACALLLVTQLSLIGIQHNHRPYLWIGIPERALIILFLLWASLLSHRLLSVRGVPTESGIKLPVKPFR